ncbi:MAG: type II secretion system protein GspD [Phycisphaerae bacterium]
MKKQTRSRILSLAITSTAIAAGVPIISNAVAATQDSPAQTLLNRGKSLLSQREFASAKKVLLAINPADLSTADRAALVGLLQKADAGIADQSTINTIFQNAQSSLDDGHLAHAVSLYQVVIASPSASPELVREAKDNLALAQAKQASMVGEMKSLLAKAKAAYAAGQLNAATEDLRQIQVSGVDLGNQASDVPHYQYLIAQKRVEQESMASEKVVAAKAPTVSKLSASGSSVKTQTPTPPETAVTEKTPAVSSSVSSSKEQPTTSSSTSEMVAEQKAQARKLAAEEAAQKAAAEQHAAEIKMQNELAAAEARTEKAREIAAAKAAAAQRAALVAEMAREQQAHEMMVQKEKAAAAAAAARAAEAAKEAEAEKAAEAAAAAKAAQRQSSSAVAIATPTPVPVVSKTNEQGSSMNAMPPAVAKTPAAVVSTPSMPSAAQINQQRSAALVVDADNMVHAAKYHQAIGLYNDALALDPQNSAARMGWEYAEKLAAGQSPGLLESELYSQAIAAQRSEVLFNHDLALSTAEMNAGKYVASLDHANDALATIEAGKQLFTQADYAAMKSRATQQIALVQAAQEEAAAKQKARQNLAVQRSQYEIEHKIAIQRRQQINELMKQALSYYKRLQYAQALDTLNQIVAIDPLNYSARFMRRQVQNQIIYNKYNHYRNEKSYQTQKQELSDEENIIPYDNLLVYPRDWPELSRMRKAEQTSSESSADTQVRKRLAESVPSISVQQQPFSDVVNLLRRETGANIVVNWNALANAGVQKQTPISLQLSNVPFEKILSLVLQEAAGSGGTPLAYSIDQGVITISTKSQLAHQMVIRLYNISDLLVQAPNFTNAPTFNLSSATQNSTSQVSSQGGGGIGNIGGGGSIFQQNNSGGMGQQQGKSRSSMVREITSLIEKTVDPNSWAATGGGTGSIRELNGQLVVSQTPTNQSKIAALLQKLRESRAIEISIDTRFLVVDTDFLNYFGFSWGLNFNGSGTTAANAIPGYPGTGNPFFGGSSIAPLQVGNNTETLAAPIATGVGNNIAHGFTSAGSALNISGGILSNYQLSLLINAVQQSEHSTILTAPRVTLFNGQEGFITVTQQQNFVASFTQTAGTGSIVGGASGIGTNLSIATLSTGVVLEVQPTVSADHRYVVMTIQPSLATLIALNTFNISGQITATQTTGNTGAGGGAPGFVQLPVIQLTQVAATVSVPDGGTLLLGGQRLVGETEVEAGVPVLSDIPIINRLFTNRSFVRDTGVLLILVRPHIIIQKEWERKQFGRNY